GGGCGGGGRREGEVIDHLRGGHAEPLGGIGLVDPDLVDRRGAAASGIEQNDAGTDELIEVLVARDDDGAEPPGGAGLGQGADDVVGLITGNSHEGYPE